METFQLPVLADPTLRESATSWLTAKCAVEALGATTQRSLDSPVVCAVLAEALGRHLHSPCPPVRFAAAHGLLCLTGSRERWAEAESPELIASLWAAKDDQSAVGDHNAQCYATEALARASGWAVGNLFGNGGGGGQRAAATKQALRQLVDARVV